MREGDLHSLVLSGDERVDALSGVVLVVGHERGAETAVLHAVGVAHEHAVALCK